MIDFNSFEVLIQVTNSQDELWLSSKNTLALKRIHHLVKDEL